MKRDNGKHWEKPRRDLWGLIAALVFALCIGSIGAGLVALFTDRRELAGLVFMGMYAVGFLFFALCQVAGEG